MPFVYILECRDGSYYTGAAVDLAARLEQHGRGRGSRYTRARLPVALVWSRRVRSWQAALRDEYRIKQLPRSGKLELIAGSTEPLLHARRLLAARRQKAAKARAIARRQRRSVAKAAIATASHPPQRAAGGRRSHA